ncbi:sensor histidine kinase, partial [Streptomyces albus subsp. chlorinus]|uniref:sensor histidine kinase n=1 Tax=Streptomyces albus TaxID=1888 RepID=UPI00156DB9B1
MAESPSYAVQAPEGIGASASTSLAVPPSRPPAPSSAPGQRRAERPRHGRPRTRENAADAAVRRRLVRLAVLPAGLIALTGTAVVAYLLRGAGVVPLTATARGVLTAGVLLAGTVLASAAVLAAAEARGTAERCAALRRATVRGQAELKSMLWTLRHGERPVPRTPAPQGEPAGDGLDLLAHQTALAQCGAEAAVAEAAALAGGPHGEGGERGEVLVSLAHRLQTLVHREIQLIDDLEHEVEDPDLLKGVFHVDHLATRIRRHSESLAVLGGAAAHRQWAGPVSLSAVLRSAVAEVEQYTRVRLVPPIQGAVRGHAVADVIHLLAELVENATAFSASGTPVLVRTQQVTAGLAVEVEDRGPGMGPGEQNELNAVLAEPDRAAATLVRDGRIGLYVVAALARRHGVVVQLQNNIYGGVQAVAVLPHSLLGQPHSPPAQESGHTAVPGREPRTPSAPGSGPDGTGPAEGGRPISGPVDDGRTDDGRTDGGRADAGRADGGSPEGGLADGGLADGGLLGGGLADGGSAGGGPVDGGPAGGPAGAGSVEGARARAGVAGAGRGRSVIRGRARARAVSREAGPPLRGRSPHRPSRTRG